MKAIRIDAKTYKEAVQVCGKHFKPGLFIIEVQHDDKCPTIRTQNNSDCNPRTCRPDFYLVQVGEGGAE